MEFYTVSQQKRPVRLPDEIRQYAWDSLHGRYGDEAVQNDSVNMDEVPGFKQMSPYEKYAAMVLKIASEAPVRICPQESVCGAATLGMAIRHQIPARFHGEVVYSSVSHLTVNFTKVVKVGVSKTEQQVLQRLQDTTLSAQQKAVLTGMQQTLKAFHIWHDRYLQATQTQNPTAWQALKNVPFAPANSFFEAVQSLWFTFAFLRLCGNWPGIGRLDEILGPYLEKDLASGALTMDKAREILAGFFIKGCEWIEKNTTVGSGDAQHYQNIVLGGMDERGNEVTNDVTYLVLDIVEELAISDFPISVRIGKQTPEKLLRRVAEVMKHGGGIVAVYNEELVIQSMMRYGYSMTEARSFANDGCWEVQVPGKTCFSYSPFDGLQILLNRTLRLDTDTPAHFDNYDALYNAFTQQLSQFLEELYEGFTQARIGVDGWDYTLSPPCSAIDLFEDGCIEKATSYFCAGPVYNVLSPHIGGMADVANSLYAIKKLVFEEKKLGFDELMKLLQNDWQGNEPLRQYALHRYAYYGNDNDEVDVIAAQVLSDFSDFATKLDGRCPYSFPTGVSTFGRQLEWRPYRTAVPFGLKKNAILSGNASPTPGTDIEGATAIIRSYCKCWLEKQTTGAALDVKLIPLTTYGEAGTQAIMGLIKAFCRLNGFFMQVDVLDAEVLREAQQHPEEYKTLSVRVSGWNARFVTLDKEWQDMIIQRTAEGV